MKYVTKCFLHFLFHIHLLSLCVFHLGRVMNLYAEKRMLSGNSTDQRDEKKNEEIINLI